MIALEILIIFCGNQSLKMFYCGAMGRQSWPKFGTHVQHCGIKPKVIPKDAAY